MKRDDRVALHNKSVTELKEELSKLRTKWTKAKLQKSAGKSENPAAVKTLADDVARIETIIREKELAKQMADMAGNKQLSTEEVA